MSLSTSELATTKNTLKELLSELLEDYDETIDDLTEDDARLCWAVSRVILRIDAKLDALRTP